jgi:uncharacterized YigZ family protein
MVFLVYGVSRCNYLKRKRFVQKFTVPPFRGRYLSGGGKQLYTVSYPCISEEIVKKSRFRAHVGRADSIQDAMKFVNTVGDKTATHNCWAFRGRTDSKCVDDGEPNGTAGRPIYAAVESSEFCNVVVVVTRYYGGIKLGAGGLSRAYYSAARLALQTAEKVELVDMIEMAVYLRAADVDSLFQVSGAYQINFMEANTAICVTFRIDFRLNVDESIVAARMQVPELEASTLAGKLAALCKGSILVQLSNDLQPTRVS